MSALAVRLADSDTLKMAECPLTRRELRILELLAQGDTYGQIACQLGTARSTIRTHLHNIYAKINVRDRAQAVLLAYQEGWLDLGEHVQERREIILLRRVDELLAELLDAVERRRQRVGITQSQERYLRAFEDYLRSPTGIEALARRSAMVGRLHEVMSEAGLDPLKPTRPRRSVR